MRSNKEHSHLYYKIFGVIFLILGVPFSLMGLIIISSGGVILRVPSVPLVFFGIKWVRKAKQLKLARSERMESQTTTYKPVNEPLSESVKTSPELPPEQSEVPSAEATVSIAWELNGEPVSNLNDTEEPEDEDDFPWGWFTENKGFTDQIKREYSHYLHTWVDSCNKSPRELYSSLKSFVRYMKDVQKLCKRKGKYFELWFDEVLTGKGYLETRQKELDDLSEKWVDLQKAYEIKEEKLTHLDDDIWNLLTLNGSMLQTDIYKNFDSNLKQDIQEKLYIWSISGKISRVKEGRTYRVSPKTE